MKALAAGFTFVARRLTQAALVMLAILIIAFAVRTALGDPLREIMGEAVPESEREQLRHELGLDAPWPVQFARYLGGAAQGDLGTSTIYKRPTLEVILAKFPASFELVLGASLIVLLFSLPAGVSVTRGEAAIVSGGLLAGADGLAAGAVGAVDAAGRGRGLPHLPHFQIAFCGGLAGTRCFWPQLKQVRS